MDVLYNTITALPFLVVLVLDNILVQSSNELQYYTRQQLRVTVLAFHILVGKTFVRSKSHGMFLAIEQGHSV